MICIILKMKLKPEKVGGLLETMHKLIPEVRKRPGNHANYFHRVPDQPDSFLFYEQ
ncbi:MAG: antibiotic biosynthesis monooxygenase [Gammaproteobacteria bacterium]